MASGRHPGIYQAQPREQWTAFFPDSHPGYITLAQHETNLKLLAANAQAHGEQRTAGPAREGSALLQGLAICGKCGLRMSVRYHTRRGVEVPDYQCVRTCINDGVPRCQNVPGAGFDVVEPETGGLSRLDVRRGRLGWVCRPPIGPGWGGAAVVLRAGESPAHGEGRQRFREGKEAAMPQDAPPNGGAPDQGPVGPWSRVAEMQGKLHCWAAADPGRRFDDLFNFLPVSYGFRPKRRAHDAVAEIQRFGTKGYLCVLDADIEACFDSISHTA